MPSDSPEPPSTTGCVLHESDSTGLRADARRNQRAILQAAAHQLAEDPTSSMQAIAEVAGLSRLTIYRRFPSREKLIEAIRLEAETEILDRLEAAAASDDPAAEALERLILDLASLVARYPLLLDLFGNRPGERPTVAPQAASVFDVLVKRGRSDGTLRADVRADVLSLVTVGGLAISLKLGHLSGRDPDEIGAEVASIILDGTRAPG